MRGLNIRKVIRDDLVTAMTPADELAIRRFITFARLEGFELVRPTPAIVAARSLRAAVVDLDSLIERYKRVVVLLPVAPDSSISNDGS